MASGEAGPNPGGWNKLTPELVRSTIKIQVDGKSLLANFTRTEGEIGTLIGAEGY